MGEWARLVPEGRYKGPRTFLSVKADLLVDSNIPGPMEQMQHVEELAGAMVGAAPEGWKQLTYVASRVGAHAHDLLVFRAADETVYRLPVPDGVYAPVEKLKQGHYGPDKDAGTWLSMTVSVHDTMKFNADYNYDSLPDPELGTSPLAYRQEMERFPRTEEHIPEWMKRKLEEAHDIDLGPIVADFGQELVRAIEAQGVGAEYLPPTGLRLHLPGVSQPWETDLKDTFDRAALHEPQVRGELAGRFAALVASQVNESGQQGPPAQDPPSDDAVGGALVAAFAALGAQVSFQDQNTLVMPMPDGNQASTDIGEFRSALKNATPAQIEEHAAGFARTAMEQLADASGQPAAAAGGSGRLRVRLYPEHAFPEEAWAQLVRRAFAPGLWQVAVMDSPDSLQPLTWKALEGAGRPLEEVFAEAVGGTLQESVDVSRSEVLGTQVVHIGGGHPYTAGQAHALARHLGQAPHGALVIFPVPEVLIAHPLGQGDPVSAMQNLQELAQRFAADADKPISTQLFWWHPRSTALGQGELPDLRPVGLEVDRDSGRATLRTSDEEFGPLLNSLMQNG